MLEIVGRARSEYVGGAGERDTNSTDGVKGGDGDEVKGAALLKNLVRANMEDGYDGEEGEEGLNEKEAKGGGKALTDEELLSNIFVSDQVEVTIALC